MKKIMTENNPEKVNDHAIAFRADKDKCTQGRDDISLLKSSIFKSEMLHLKLEVPKKKKKRIVKNS